MLQSSCMMTSFLAVDSSTFLLAFTMGSLTATFILYHSFSLFSCICPSQVRCDLQTGRCPLLVCIMWGCQIVPVRAKILDTSCH